MARASRGHGYVRHNPARKRFEAILVASGRKHTRVASYTSDRTRPAARRRADALLDELRAQHPEGSVSSQESVAEYLARWLEFMKPPRLAHSTWRMHDSRVRLHIVPQIGSVQLDRLATHHVDALLARASRHLSPATVAHVRKTLYAALAQAEIWRVIPRNPVALTRAPRVPNIERVALSPVEAEKFLDHVRGDRLEALWNIAACLGLRSGEVRGLQWSDVPDGYLRVERSLAYEDGRYVLRETKTPRSRRRVPLPAFIAELLEVRRDQQAFEAKGPGYRNELGLIFTSPLGRPLSTWGTTSRLQDLLGKAGVTKVNFHDLRHCATSLLLSRGVPLRMVQEVLGHASPSMTLGTYAHSDEAQRRDVARLLDEWRSR